MTNNKKRSALEFCQKERLKRFLEECRKRGSCVHIIKVNDMFILSKSIFKKPILDEYKNNPGYRHIRMKKPIGVTYTLL